MTQEFILQMTLVIGSICGVYAVIKADLTRAITIAEIAARDAANAHVRITDHVDRHHTNQHSNGG
jgi:hypothetical protein